jgi:hypothetical protein
MNLQKVTVCGALARFAGDGAKQFLRIAPYRKLAEYHRRLSWYDTLQAHRA